MGVHVLSVYAHLERFEQLLEINILAVTVVESLGIMIETRAKISAAKMVTCYLLQNHRGYVRKCVRRHSQRGVFMFPSVHKGENCI